MAADATTATQNGGGPAHQAGSGPGLWSEILNSVKNTRGVPTKNILLLGGPSTGKRTLLKALAAGSASSTFADPQKEEQDELTAAAAATATTATQGTGPAPDLVLPSGMPLLGPSYGYWDVADDDSEGDLLARVGVWTLPSSDLAYCDLLNFAFSPEEPTEDIPMRKLYSTMAASVFSQHKSHQQANGTNSGIPATSSTAPLRAAPSLESLSKTLIVLVLDWTQPHTFLDQLRRWLVVIRRVINDASAGALDRGKGGTNLKWSAKWAALDEMREQLEHVFTSYREPQGTDMSRFNAPTSSSAARTAPASTTGEEPSSDPVAAPSSPLQPSLAALDMHYRAPLGEGTLEPDSNWGMEIAVVCTKADTMGKLETERQFKEEQFDYVQQVLRVICLKYGAALFYTSGHRAESVALLRQYLLNRLFDRSPGSVSHQFRLTTRASTVDRDTVFVPAGWDSYDMEVELARRERLVQGAASNDPDLQDGALRTTLFGPDAASQQSTVASFEGIVGDWHARESPITTGSKVASPDNQEFLSQLYTLLLKEPDAGPRTGAGTGTAGATDSEASRKQKNSSAVELAHDDVTRRTVVGPLAAASLGTLSKFTAEGEADVAAPPKSKSKEKKERSRPDVDSLSGSRPSSGSGSQAGGSQRQKEKLQTFFKSLLKDQPSAPPTSNKGSRSSRKAAHSSTEAGGPPNPTQ